MAGLTPNERMLTEQLSEANETIRQLRIQLVPPTYLTLQNAGFSKSEACLLDCLSDGHAHPVEALTHRLDVVLLYRQESGADRTTFNVISRTRRKLERAPSPMRIDRVRGGYAMPAASLATLRAMRQPSMAA